MSEKIHQHHPEQSLEAILTDSSDPTEAASRLVDVLFSLQQQGPVELTALQSIIERQFPDADSSALTILSGGVNAMMNSQRAAKKALAGSLEGELDENLLAKLHQVNRILSPDLPLGVILPPDHKA